MRAKPFGERRPSTRWKRPRGDWAYWVSQGIVRSIFSGFIRRQLHGYENIAALRRGKEGFVLAANHISHFDGPILTMTAPGAIDWLVTEEFFLPYGLGAWMRKSGGICLPWPTPVLGAVRESLRRLRGRRALGIFPEGGLRSGATSVLEGAPIARGAAWMAARERVPIVPCVILGTDRLYVARNWQPWRGRVPVWIGFGPPIRPDEWPDPSAGLLGERLRTLYEEMKTTFRLKPDDLPMTCAQRNAECRMQNAE